jgi:hypothetical protein
MAAKQPSGDSFRVFELDDANHALAVGDVQGPSFIERGGVPHVPNHRIAEGARFVVVAQRDASDIFPVATIGVLNRKAIVGHGLRIAGPGNSDWSILITQTGVTAPFLNFATMQQPIG